MTEVSILEWEEWPAERKILESTTFDHVNMCAVAMAIKTEIKIYICIYLIFRRIWRIIYIFNLNGQAKWKKEFLGEKNVIVSAVCSFHRNGSHLHIAKDVSMSSSLLLYIVASLNI